MVFRRVLACGHPSRGRLNTRLAYSGRQEHGAAFYAALVEHAQDVGRLFKWELLGSDLDLALSIELHQLGQVVVGADDIAEDGELAQQQVDGAHGQRATVADL